MTTYSGDDVRDNFAKISSLMLFRPARLHTGGLAKQEKSSRIISGSQCCFWNELFFWDFFFLGFFFRELHVCIAAKC